MSSVKPLDLMFFLLETANRPVHMAGFELFELPRRYSGDYFQDLMTAFRSGKVGAPFNRVITGLERGRPRWKEVEPDLRHHVRHIAVPAPGTMAQLYEMVSFLNAPLLDRSRPLWECYVIEGIQHDRFAVLIRVHHALMDGMGGMKLFEQSLNTDGRSREFRRLWEPRGKRGRKKVTKAASGPSYARLVPGIQKAATRWLDSGRSLATLKPQNLLMPFGASRTVLNKPLRSNDRRFAGCDLPLPEIKRIGKASGCTVNDVVMTAIDLGLERYLGEQGEPLREPLRILMPMSLAHRSAGGGGNQVSVLLTELGEPGQAPRERLLTVRENSARIKTEASKVPPAALQLYTMLLAVGGVAAETVPGMDRNPTNNVLISNMPGPREQLYLAGAPLLGFYGLPIVAPGTGLNVTFLSCGDSICLAIGAIPEAVDDATLLADYIQQALGDLARAIDHPKKAPSKRKAQPRRRKR